jgi:hypothetical protein
MSATIARPTFYEGEILPAADLGASVDYARNQMARHERYLHSWGIATGLDLTFANGAATLSAGVAIDGTGREIVVPADIQLDFTTFDVYVETDSNTWYPVFLTGMDQPVSPSSNLTGACGNSQSTSTQEVYQVTFGSPGSELQAPGTSPALTDPPDGTGSGVWQVLVGFVQVANNAFSAAQSVISGNGPQYVGVNAAQVISPSGSLLLATGPAAPAGSNPVMAVQITESPNPQLIFGQLGANGQITTRALTVAANGDVTAAGQISGAVTPGSMQVQSGIAFDGMTLPLPIGIDPTDVAAGKVTVHTLVSVHYESQSPPNLILAIPVECRVDASTRQVHCKVIDITAGPPFINIMPAWCDYLVIVAVPASSGGGS